MLTQQNTTKIRKPSIVTLPPGTVVEVKTEAYGMQLGTVAWTVISPYYHEAKAGIHRTFVVSLPYAPAWTEYIKPEDLRPTQVCDCTGCDRSLHESQMCPECGYCLAECCECKTQLIEADDLDDEYDAWLDKCDRDFDDMMDARAIRENS